MAWIESHQELARHPKTRKLARALGVSVPCAIGHLHLLWWWALDYADDGELGGFDPEDLAEAAMWNGEPQAFIAALQSAGFLDELTIHDWQDYGGKLTEKRRADAERKREARRRTSSATSSSVSPLVQRTSSGHPTPVRSPSQVEQSTVHNTTAENSTAAAREAKPSSLVVPESRGTAAAAALLIGDIEDLYVQVTGKAAPQKEQARLVQLADSGADLDTIRSALSVAAHERQARSVAAVALAILTDQQEATRNGRGTSGHSQPRHAANGRAGGGGDIADSWERAARGEL